MNQGPDFQQPADDSQDPLLRALRERLGAGFGQEPPPALWAGIRRQLPPPRPWWRRSRRLLPLLALLAGLLVVGGLAVRQAHSPRQPVAVAAGSDTRPPRPTIRAARVPGSLYDLRTEPYSTTQNSKTPAASTSTAADTSSPPSLAESQVAGHQASSNAQHSKLLEKTSQSAGSFRTAPEAAWPLLAPNEPLAAARRQPGGGLSGAGRAARTRRPPQHPGHAATNSFQYNNLTKNIIAAEVAAATPRHHARPPLASAARPASGAQGRLARDAAARAATSPAPGVGAGQRRRSQQPVGSKPLIASRDGRPASRGAHPAAATLAGPLAAALAPPAALDSLAFRPAPTLLSTSTLPSPLAAHTDSSGPWLPVARRWSVLVLAGPSVSYRTLATQAAGLAYSSLPSTTVNAGASSLAAGSGAGLEQPALSVGAQVQVRRVLTGRWALALGAGYQEYATRLAGQVTVQRTGRGTYSAVSDSSLTVRQRDTYRLLTLPVQLSYVLGPPHGRLALGLLAGLEPSLYVGGRTTVVSATSVYQQDYTAASGSPYNTLSLALSLGLEARYRLGSPASRWQLVVQPTGRYLATPFVRSTALDYARRQPYSLGLLTGLSWEF